VTPPHRTYLVTGGLGFIGASLARRLVHDGHRVRVFDDGSRGAEDRLGREAGAIEVVHGDIRDPDAVRRATAGVDAVCHLAFINGTRHFYERPTEVLDVGVKGVLNVIDACLAGGVGELILASSSEVYQTPPVIPTDERVPLVIPDPLNPRYSYAAGKIISEVLALNYGRNHLQRVIVFRPHNVYGPAMGWDHVVPEFITRLRDIGRKAQLPAMSGALPFHIQGTGMQTRSFMYIDDFVDALRVVMDSGTHQGIYHIGTTEELSIGDVARKVAEQIGLDIRIVPGEAAQGGVDRRCPDVGKLHALGFRPRYSFDQGLARTIPWYLAHEPGGQVQLTRLG
jgi:nucleoside-diphosphate-sugar epimerase